jgi:plastocyanin
MNNTNLLIPALIVIALVVGAILFMNMQGLSAPTIPDSSGDTNTGAMSGSSEEDRALLMPPANSAPQEEQQAYAEQVMQKARSTSQVSLGVNCAANPLIVRIDDGASLTFKNDDSTTHTIIFNEDHSYVLEPGAAKSIGKEILSRGGGMYSYGCDAISGPAGMIVVNKE